MVSGIDIALVTMNIINMLYHAMGSFLLISIYKRRRQTTQQLYIINLSLTEFIACVMILLEEFPDLIPMNITVSTTLKLVDKYLYVIIYVIFCLYYISMMFITMDRLLGVLLNIKYPIYWSKRKTKYLLLTTWIIVVIACVVVSTIYKLTKFDYKVFFTTYIHSILNFNFILLVLFTYTYIFHQYTRSVSRIQVTRHQSACSRLFHSKFYVSFLLIVSFLIFMVIPNIFYLIYGKLQRGRGNNVEDIIKLFYQFSFTSDATIYIFMQTAVRRRLWRTLGLSNIEHRDYTTDGGMTTTIASTGV